MLKENSILRQEAREALKDNWGNACVFTILYTILAFAVSFLIILLFYPILLNFSSMIANFILFPIVWGYTIGFLILKRGQALQVSYFFDGYKDFLRISGTLFLQYIYTFLWTLLLIIPGIAKYYSYSQTYYILKDFPELSYNKAIEKSMEMMSGSKMKLFLLDLSFIGWALLCILTLGIGIFWLSPYMSTAHACFYEDLKKERGMA